MNKVFDSGYKVVTSYRNSKNYDTNWITAGYSLWFIREAKYLNNPRMMIKTSCAVSGTGYLVDSSIIKKNHGWKCNLLTEDIEFTVTNILDGEKVGYCEDAMFYDEQPTSLKVALRQRLRWSKGHLQAFAESGWGLFKNIFVDKHTEHKEDDAWYDYLWRTIRHRFMSFDTFAQLVPKNIVYIAKWILTKLILYPFIVWKIGATFWVFNGDSYIATLCKHIFGNINITLAPGWKSYGLSLLLVIWARIFYRICKYFINIWIAVYIFIIEYKRIPKFSIWRKILYCFTWPTFDIIQRYTQYVALFKKVEWKPIPHNSKVTIEDIEEGA